MRQLILALAFIMLFAGPARGVTRDPPSDLNLKDLNGDVVKLSSFKGKVVLINFWATWCDPCKEEIPFLVEFYERYKGAGLVILGVNLDKRRKKVPPFVVEFGINYPILMGGPKDAGDWAIRGVPMSFFVNREGKIVEIFMGPRSKAAFESEIKKLLQTP